LDTTQLLGIDKGAIQISHLDAVFYLNSVLQLNATHKLTKEDSYIRTYEFESPLTMSPRIVKSHVSQEYGLLVQDSLNNLYLLSSELKRQWTTPIDGRITSFVDQIDFYRNGKLQYFFVTSNQMHVVDRLGRKVENFPLPLPKNDMDFADVVDYDNSRRYRYLFTDSKGNLYLTDKDGSLLEGWSPRPTGGKLIATARHYRVLGRDYFIAVQQNGSVHLMNRRGEIVEGFPVSLSTRPGGDYFLNRGRDRKTTHFIVVSEDGHKIQIDLDGKVTRSDVLPRHSASSRFSLVKTPSEDSFVYLRVDAARLAVIDANGRPLFEMQNTGSDQWQVDILQTDLKEKVFCFYDPQQNFSYFFNEAGRSLLSRPLESDLLPSMHYHSNQRTVQVFNVFGKELSTVPIKLD
jgi:hypothetical protein